MISQARLAVGVCAGLSGIFVVYGGYSLYREMRKPSLETAMDAIGSSIPSPSVTPEPIPPTTNLAVQSQSYTNEELHDLWVQEQKRMGINKIDPPGESADQTPPIDPNRARRMQTARAKMKAMTLEIQRAIEARKKAPIVLQGDKTPLLSAPENSYLARGSPLAIGSESSATLPDGAVLRPQEELDSFWEAMKSSRPRPQIDFDKQMLVVVIADPTSGHGISIPNIRRNSGKLIVLYRDALPGEIGSYYEFQIVNKTDATVVFQRLPSSSTAPHK